MGLYSLLAEAFCYPAPGRIEALEEGLAGLAASPARTALLAFIGRIQALPLGEWEELYTRTFDLSPAIAPYVGFQTWGESYPRGAFMASLSRELQGHQVDLGGELPDHLIPVLRYLEVAPQPLPELVEILEPAIQRMLAVLSKSDRTNPYLHLLDAAQKAAGSVDIKSQTPAGGKKWM